MIAATTVLMLPRIDYDGLAGGVEQIPDNHQKK